MIDFDDPVCYRGTDDELVKFLKIIKEEIKIEDFDFRKDAYKNIIDDINSKINYICLARPIKEVYDIRFKDYKTNEFDFGWVTVCGIFDEIPKTRFILKKIKKEKL